MKSKKEMVKQGKIEDLRIFKLMYLEKSINESKLLAELKKRAINDQIEQLKAERQSHARAFELRVRELTEQSAGLRRTFEEDYDIELRRWGYDDSTGILVPLPPDTLNAMDSQKSLQKNIDSERQEEKKKRGRKKRKPKVEVPKDESKAPADEKEKPPSEQAEA